MENRVAFTHISVAGIAGYSPNYENSFNSFSAPIFLGQEKKKKNFYVTEWLMMIFDFYTKKGKNIENPLFISVTKHRVWAQTSEKKTSNIFTPLLLVFGEKVKKRVL